jgi:hypothetical protein
MGERIGRIGRIDTDFFVLLGFRTVVPKKIRANPPDPPNPFSHRIANIPKSEIHIPKSQSLSFNNMKERL